MRGDRAGAFGSFFRLMYWFPKIRGTFLGIPIIRTIVYLESILGGPLILGNYHVELT